jgi:hypothetical protein
MRFVVRYHRAQDLLADHDAQFRHGGVLVRVSPPPGLNRDDRIEIVVAAAGVEVTCQARVAQILPGAGVAALFDPGALAELIETARQRGEEQGGPPEHAMVPTERPPAPDTGHRPAATATPRRADDDLDAPDTYAQYKAANPTQKIQMALRGNRAARNLALRDLTNKQLPLFVLRNPNLGLDEVGAIARMSDVATTVLQAIAERREWSHRPDIALALVRNPKTPVPMALQLLGCLDQAEIRRLGKDGSVRQPIKVAAAKRLGQAG